MIALDTCFLIDLYWDDSPRHQKAVSLFKKLAADKTQELAVYYNCFYEFMHVITDARRFEDPLTMEEALFVIDQWCDLERVTVLYPDDSSFKRTVTWLSMYRLGRNRINDTQMAAAYVSNACFSLVTANPRDFETFGMLSITDYSL